MNASRLLLDLSPSRLELALERRGRIVHQQHEEPGADIVSAAELIDRARSMVRSTLASHSWAKGARCLIAWRGPQTAAGLTSVAPTLDEDAAEQAALLALADTGVEADAAESATVLPLADAQQTHVLASRESDEVIAQIELLCVEAGLKLERVVSSESLAIRAAVASASSVSRGSVAASLWFGDDGSALAICSGGRLRLVRTISIGKNVLIEAVTRPLRRPGETSSSVCLSREHARRLVDAMGFPEPHTPLPGLEGFFGSSLLPALQPVLQRLALELKQTIRYSASGSSQERATLSLLGPGAALPGVAQMLARQADVDPFTAPEVDGEQADVSRNADLSPMLRALVTWNDVPALCSAATRRRRVLRPLTRCAMVGTGLALVLVGQQWLSTLSRTESLRLEVATHAMARADRSLQVAALDLAEQRRTDLAKVLSEAGSVIGVGPDAVGVLAALSPSDSATVQLTAIDLGREEKTQRASVQGRVAMEAGVDATETIRAYVASLTRHPMIAQARLGRTARVEESGSQYQTFEVMLDVVALPPRVTQAPTEGEP